MPKRNVVLLVACLLASLAAWAAREQGGHGHRFGEVMAAIERHSIDEVDSEALFTSAVESVVAQLDEHSSYLHDTDRSDLEAALDQEFGGVGLELSLDPSLRQPVVVASVFPGPAWRAGITAGDRIVAVNGSPTSGLPLRDVVNLLRGKAGQPIEVTVSSASELATLDPLAPPPPECVREISLVRQTMAIETVKGDRRANDGSWSWTLEGDPDVAYVRIESFGERTADEFSRAVESIAAIPSLRSVIIDLRGNPGGLMRGAVEVCDTLLDEGVIVVTQSRRGDGAAAATITDVRRATTGSLLADLPIVVLVDGLTASAAEIVAACLQDAGRARVVGSRSFGKGTVQSLIPLSDGRGLLKLTSSEYLRPSRERIHRRSNDGDDATWGVSPDAGCEVTPTAEAVERLRAWQQARGQVPPPAGGASGVQQVSTSASRAALPREIDSVLARAIEVTTTGR